MNQPAKNKGQVETTGHVWDGDLREYNNPLPRWWLWAFYGTIVFAVIYWILYPAWPYADTFTKGVEKVSYKVHEKDGSVKTVTEHWNSRALFTHDMQSSPSALAQQKWVAKVKDMSFDQIVANPDTLNFARSMGHAMFGDHCAACHGTGGQGKIPYFPNLVDNAWIHGSSYDKIVQDITNGIHGNMPAFASIKGEKADDLAQYVLSLSGQKGVDQQAANRGKSTFATCAGCHGAHGKGNPAIGAPNLTDQVWTFVDIPGAKNIDQKVSMIKHVFQNGLKHHMPAFGDRLSPVQIKMLAVYVRQLGGG